MLELARWPSWEHNSDHGMPARRPGFLDCNNDLSNVLPTNGCEINGKADNENCGSWWVAWG